MDRADTSAAGRAVEDRACVSRREAAAPCLVRRTLGARPCGYGWTAAVRDRAAYADRPIQHFTACRSPRGAGLRRAPTVRGGRPRPKDRHYGRGPGLEETHVAGLCARHQRSGCHRVSEREAAILANLLTKL